MFEFMASGGQYIAIVVLCVSCWMAGHAVREPVFDPAPAPDNDAALRVSSRLPRTRSSKAGGANALNQGQSECDGRNFNEASERDCLDRSDCPAFAMQRLIRTGDLSQEGVLESLVAMAEEQAELEVLPTRRAVPPSWRSASATGAPPTTRRPVTAPSQVDRCGSARILKRDGRVTEPLPARLDNPITPEVLNRYRLYAREYAPALPKLEA